MAIAPLNVAPTAPAANAFDFSSLAKLGQTAPQDTTLASLGGQYGALPATPFPAGGTAPVPYAASGSGQNVQSWYDFAVKPLDQGGLGLTQAQAAGAVGNLQAESGANIPSWGTTGDAGSAHGAAQWRNDRFEALQRFAQNWRSIAEANAELWQGVHAPRISRQ